MTGVEVGSRASSSVATVVIRPWSNDLDAGVRSGLVRTAVGTASASSRDRAAGLQGVLLDLVSSFLAGVNP